MLPSDIKCQHHNTTDNKDFSNNNYNTVPETDQSRQVRRLCL